MTSTDAVREAVDRFDSLSDFARTIGVKPPTVCQWLSGSRPVPPGRAISIERATNGAVKRETLCPGFPWEEARSA